jgi:membrane protease subunit (stomatin/prohibitin family)
MSFFKSKEGGFSDVIRCDQDDYLIWKWRPKGADIDSVRSNSIRYGSSLRIKEGELAVFVYEKEDKPLYEFIHGPIDDTIKTANFPVLSSIVGLAFNGESPFQAEIYFINLSGNIQLKFGVPFFDVFDTRFPDLGIPCSVRGTLTFNLTDYSNFIKLNRLRNFEIHDFKNQVKDSIIRKTKSTIMNIIETNNIPVLQIERKIDELSDVIQEKMNDILVADFGINIKRMDISAVDIDKSHDNYTQLKRITVDQQSKIIEARADIEIENLDETMRINRKDLEMGVEGKNLQVHQINKQADVLKTAAESLGEMGSGEGGGGTMDMGSMMASMTLGGAIGTGMAGMMGSMMNGMQQSPSNQTPPPAPNSSSYNVVLGGKSEGPFNLIQIQAMISSGQLNLSSLVWKPGFSNWVEMGTIDELKQLFTNIPPPIPPSNPSI